MRPAFELQQATACHAGRTLLQEASWQVSRGAIAAVESPRGKSAHLTINVFLGYVRLTRGKALVAGLDAWQDAVTVQQQLAHSPSHIDVWPKLTVRETVEFLLSMHPDERDAHAQLAELANRFGLDTDQPVVTLDASQKQLCALTAALCRQVDYYLLPNALSELDSGQRAAVLSVMAERQATGATFVISGSHADELSRTADQLLRLNDGLIPQPQ